MVANLAACACFLLLSATQTVAQYSCGDPTDGGHCYGEVGWQSQGYAAAYTEISQTSMGCPPGCGGFVDNEMWLIDSKTPACKDSVHGLCWVEVGYYFEENADSKQFFWADFRPPGQVFLGGGVLGPVGRDDPVGFSDHYAIVEENLLLPGDNFQVNIWNNSLSTLFRATSVGDPINPNIIVIGQELAGRPVSASAEAHAGIGFLFRFASFRNNAFSISGSPMPIFWLPQSNDGSVRSDNPPIGRWEVRPSSPGSNPGGIFITRCCMP
jgi:hypothetical protein